MLRRFPFPPSLLLVGVFAYAGSSAALTQEPTPTATFQLPTTTARRGTETAVPFVVRASSSIQGVSFSLDFDEEVLVAKSIERAFHRSDGEEWHLYFENLNNTNVTPGNAGVDEGYLTAAFIFSFDSLAPGVIPPGNQDNELLRLGFEVRADAPLGVTHFQFIDGAEIARGSPGVENVCTVLGQDANLGTEVSPLLVDGRLAVVGDVSLFRRGDTNYDSALDVTDALATLNFLFRNGATPPCLDAADANDDGRLDVSDPISFLTALFSSRATLPPPGPEAGADTTTDTLDCAVPVGT